MTPDRERTLEEALRPFAEYADKNRRLPGDHIITQGSRFAKRQLTMADCYAAADALSSAQEPAPYADAEEVARELVNDWFDCISETPSETSIHHLKKVIAAALRRYACDGGVTDEMVEAAWLVLPRCEAGKEQVRIALEAAARAKSSEKGGAI
jgi:hypothetical protein